MIKNLLKSRAAKIGANVNVALTQLRQICCHPQIVRRDDGLLGSSGQRLTMEQIVGKLVDQSRSAWFGAQRDVIRSLVKLAQHPLCGPGAVEGYLHRAFQMIVDGRREDEDGDARHWITVELAAYQALQVVQRREAGGAATAGPSTKRRHIVSATQAAAALLDGTAAENFIAKASDVVVQAVTNEPLRSEEAVTLDADTLTLRISGLATYLGLDDESRVILPGESGLVYSP